MRTIDFRMIVNLNASISRSIFCCWGISFIYIVGVSHLSILLGYLIYIVGVSHLSILLGYLIYLYCWGISFIYIVGVSHLSILLGYLIYLYCWGISFIRSCFPLLSH